MVSSYEKQYMDNLKNIYDNGFFSKNERTGVCTRRIASSQIIVDLEKEFPILLSKKVNWKVCADEIFWIMQKNSNNVHELNSKIWNQWADEDGSIGKTYGYQVGKPTNADEHYRTQVEYILKKLAKDPSNRQCVIDMWDPEEIDEMNLPPCVYSSIWSVIDGRLNCMVVQRSSDYPVGVPFDTTGYAILTYLFARHLGVKPGLLTHVMADSHIYENQIEGVKKQFEQYATLLETDKKAPKLVFKEGAPTDFWAISVDDIDIVDYDPLPFIKYDVAK